jgi:tetratricopeptide (TPR) repeat protein
MSAVTSLDGAWADAIFLRGFAEIDLRDLEAARRDYARALAQSPRNPHYLSEMGELHSTLHDWQAALEFYAPPAA